MSTNSTDAAANRTKDDDANRTLASIRPFFIVKDLRVSISYYIERLGFQLDFQGPDDDPYYAGVSRDGIGIMLKAILPDVLPQPNHTRHEWARWDACIYTQDPDALFGEFSQRGALFVKELSFIDEGLWGFEVTDADGYVVAFFHLRRDEGPVADCRRLTSNDTRRFVARGSSGALGALATFHHEISKESESPALGIVYDGGMVEEIVALLG
jgi:catechol 2,3-dioxygenase-like lactoylglutathione lyase family enzyme